MDFALGELHFIRPIWLLLLPVAVLLWLGLKRTAGHSQWADHIPEQMLAALQIKSASKSSFWRAILLTLWLVLIVAAAGPSWDKQAVPTVENQKALAILLDLSPSMMATDLTPNRLTRARYKLIDILRKHQDGQVALIAYAGDAHTVSPLSDDPRTLEALLPALSPEVMPSSGSNVEAAVELAQKLLKDAGAPTGDLLLISDGVTEQAARNLSRLIDDRHRLSVLAVGSKEATPVPLQSGGFLRGNSGEIVLTKINSSRLRSLASDTGGKFSRLSNDGSDIDSLLFDDYDSAGDDNLESETSYDAWVDNGHWLIVLMLPLALWFFRRGLVYVLPLFFILPINSEAAETASSAWRNLWQTPDQQAAALLQQEQAEQAAQVFKNEDWSAIANYRNGDFEQAAAKLEGKSDVTSLYNRANALALSGDLDSAIEIYETVLEKQPEHVDAKHNKEVLEKLKQESQDNQSSEEGQDNSEKQDSSDEQQNSEQENSAEQSNDAQESDKSQSEEENQQAQQDQSSEQQESESPDDSPEQTQEQSEQQNAEQGDQTEQDSDADTENEDAVAEQQSEEEQTETEQEALSISEDDQQSETQLKDSSEQWLRTIPDDPSGLLRRKFEYQSRLRQQPGSRNSNTNDEQRY